MIPLIQSVLKEQPAFVVFELGSCSLGRFQYS